MKISKCVKKQNNVTYSRVNKVKKAQVYELEIGTNISSTLDSKVKIIYTEGDNFLVFSKVKLEDWLERV